MTVAVASTLPVPILGDLCCGEQQNEWIPDSVVSALPLAASSPKKRKKPQMKYDPDVPMTKEEAAVWRREQRRKRNRESAAASRQRQRDRIVELEAQLDEYKRKYKIVMDQVRQGGTTTPTPDLTGIQTVTPRASPTLSSSTSTGSTNIVSPTESKSIVVSDGEGKEEEPSKMISRHALS